MRAILRHPDTSILGAAGALMAITFACGLCVPPMFGLILVLAVVSGVGFLALCFPTRFCVGWMVLTGMSLEMTLLDLAGTEAYQPSIAVIKAAGITLGVVCAIRYGPRLDPLNPSWAYLAMLLVGLLHGLHPGLTAADSARSTLGSVAPFVFCFCRLPRDWPDAIIRAAKWCPTIAVLAGIPLALAGIRPLFIDSGGARLAGLGHPAFLAGVCLPAIYACLIQLYREGRRGDQFLLVVNFLILVLTGARAPLAYAMAVTGLSLVSIRSTVYAVGDRRMLVLGALALLPIIAMLAGTLDSGALEEVRLFNIVFHEAGNLSGRTLLWPRFEDAAAQSPWFGWGLGAGNTVIPVDSRLARTLHTWAAHNEYLRIEVEGGWFGEALLIVLFTAWVLVHTSRLRLSDRRILRLAFIAFACHAFTDNVLISTPASVLFTFATAAFARKTRE
jgi:O-antigen ligase